MHQFMISIRITLALSATAWLAACATTSTYPEPQKDASPALWKVSDQDSSIYLFGTIHSLPRGVPWQTIEVTEAVDQSEMLVTESNAWFGHSWTTNRIIRTEGFYPKGQSLSDTLDPETRDRLFEAGQAIGYDIEEMDRMRPWLVAFNFGATAEDDLRGSRRYGVETILYEQAETRDLPLSRLEIAPDVMRAMTKLDEADQIQMLEAALEDVENAGYARSYHQLIDVWLEGDPERLSDLHASSSLWSNSAFYDVLLTNRNTAWMDPLEDLLANDTQAFVAVGAAHLAGPDSVAALLEDRGYEVVRVDRAGLLETRQ